MDAEKITWLCLITKNRAALARGCLEALNSRRHAGLRIIAIDAGSDDDTPSLLHERWRDGVIQRLILNPVGKLPQWQKNAVLEQFATFLRGQDCHYAGWIDNDIIVKPGWLEAAVECLKDIVRAVGSGQNGDRRIGKAFAEDVDTREAVEVRQREGENGQRQGRLPGGEVERVPEAAAFQDLDGVGERAQRRPQGVADQFVVVGHENARRRCFRGGSLWFFLFVPIRGHRSVPAVSHKLCRFTFHEGFGEI